MSKLSRLIRKYRKTTILHAIVDYLDDIDLPAETKKGIAVAIAKALHVKTGGKWDKEIQEAVSGAIEWALVEVREAAKEIQEPKPEDGPVEVSPV